MTVLHTLVHAAHRYHHMSRTRRKLATIYVGTLFTLAHVSIPVHANPELGAVISGSVAISGSGKKLDVIQNTDKAIIDWRSFNIAPDEHTQFHQPNSNSVALNRVLSNDPSQILGKLSANGNIILINPNGVFFGANSKVDVNGLIASTANISNQDFLAGNMNFNIAGNPNASIINQGLITAAESGLVGLVAPNVENSGIISAHLGKVHLATGDTFTMDMVGDNLITVAVSDKVAKTVLKNTGTINAEGGQIMMTAAAGKELVDSLVHIQGELNAPTVSERNGKIIISAASLENKKSTVILEDAKINASGEKGGSVTVTGDQIAVLNSQIDVSGTTGGGTALIGGDYQGTGDTQRSQVLYFDDKSSVDANATQIGNGGKVVLWSDNTTRFYGNIAARGGAVKGDGGAVEVSGKGYLDFQGNVDTIAINGQTGTLLLDPDNITICLFGGTTCGAAQTPQLPSPFTLASGGADSFINIGAADGSTNNSLLKSLTTANVTVTSSGAGGNITVIDPISIISTNTRTLTLSALGSVIINAPITVRNLTISASDVAINSSLISNSTAGILTIQQATEAGTMGIAGGVGTMQIDSTDIANFAGWSGSTVLGRTDGTGAINVGATNWAGSTTIQSMTGAINITGAQTMAASKNLTLTTQNLNIGAALNGTSTLTIQQNGNVSMGVGDGAGGTLQLDNSELDNITNGWSSLIFGSSTSTSPFTVNARTWNDATTFRTGTGALTIAGTQTMGANALTLTTRNLNLDADLVGTGTLTIQPDTSALVGLGDGAGGTLQLDNTELSHIINGWGSLVMGAATNTIGLIANQFTWLDNLTLRSSTGALTIAGAQNMGANNLTITTSNLNLNSDVIGTGTLTIQPNTNATVGLGDGAAGTLQLDNAELDRIQNGWSSILLNTTTNTLGMTVNPYTWRDNVTLRSGVGPLTIAGAQNMGTNNLTISTSNLNLNAPLIGTGILTIQPNTNATMGLGNGAIGTLQLDTSELDNITDGWSSLVFGLSTNTLAMTVNQYNWRDNTTFRSATGEITFAGTQNFDNNDAIITTSNLNIGADLNGTGNLTIQPNTNALVGLGDGAGGTLQIDNAELDRIKNGWSSLTLGSTTNTMATTIGARTWVDPVTFRSLTGALIFSGAQNFGTNNATMSNRGVVDFQQSINGTGVLSISPVASSHIMEIGSGAIANTQTISTASLDNISNNWSKLLFGRSDQTGTLKLNAYSNWKNNTEFASNTGTISILGAQNFGANNATFATNSNLAISAPISGTGTLNITPGAITTSVGLAGGTGTLNLSTTELNNITDGWSKINIGRSDSTAAMTINTYSAWKDSTEFLTGNAINISGNQTSNSSLTYSGPLVLTGDRIIDSGNAATIFNSTVNGNIEGRNLTLLGTGLTTFNDVVGGVNRLGTLAIAGSTVMNTSSINSTGNQTYTGELSFAGTATRNFNATSGNLSFGAITAGSNNLTFTLPIGNINLGGNITSNTALAFTKDVQLTNDISINAGTSNIGFQKIDGLKNLDLTTTGNITFFNKIGDTDRLSKLKINNSNNVTATNTARVTDFEQTGGAGITNFNNLDALNNIDITSKGITGVYKGLNGDLNAQTGYINANVSFNTLDIAGAGATLTAGYIGAPGIATKSMADLISINGVTAPTLKARAGYTFAGFPIGYVPPTIQNIPAAMRWKTSSTGQESRPLNTANPIMQFKKPDTQIQKSDIKFEQPITPVDSKQTSSNAQSEPLDTQPQQSDNKSAPVDSKNEKETSDSDSDKPKKKTMKNLFGLLN